MLPESQKENRINITEKKPMVNPYFMVISGRFKMAKYITLCVLVVFLLATIVLFRDEITVENLRYLVKDFEMGDNVNLGSTDTVTFDSDLQVNLALYKGDLVVAGSTYFTLSDLQGNRRLSESSSFSNPVIVSSDKYLLVYGLSEYTYTIYNTFSKLHSDTFNYPITCAAVSDSGKYAIVTRSAEYRSVVYIYNESFERIGAVYKDKYVMDVQFNKDGSELLITSLFSKDGSYSTEIVNYVPFSESASSTITVDGSMPLKTGYNKDGGYSIVYDNKIEFYDKDFILKNTYEFPANLLLITSIVGDEYTVITYNENIVGDDIKVCAFNSNGEMVLDASADGKPKKLKCRDDNVFVLLEGKICKIASKAEMLYITIRKGMPLNCLS